MADIFIDWVVSAKGYDKFLLISNMTVSPSHSPNIPPAQSRLCPVFWPTAKREGVLYPPRFLLFLSYRT